MKEDNHINDKYQTEGQELDFGSEEDNIKETTVRYLGKTFPDEKARRDYFSEELRKKLQNPEFRKIEGFPIGSDEDILALSDPPYYTACPNPWIADFIAEWEAEKSQKPADYQYHRKPFATDVSEGKNDPIYNAHSYHTKVPHKAIMRYILHYTEPGDIVFDGFCGTGMTGVAAQLCGDKKTVESLGYMVQDDGTILQEELIENGKKNWIPFSKLGPRRAVLNDLSPVATFISYNYNTPVDVNAFEKEAKRILKEVEEECGWMYETIHTDGKTKSIINYTVWSDVFICPFCVGELIFWDVAVEKDTGKVKEFFSCPRCNAELTKKKVDRAWISKYDPAIDQTIKQAKQIPVLINYTIGRKRYEKSLDGFDLDLLDKIEQMNIPYWFPTNKISSGDKTGEAVRIGVTHYHHFYRARNLYVIAKLFEYFRVSCGFSVKSHILFNLTALFRTLSKLEIYRSEKKCAAKGSFNHLYFPSLSFEANALVEFNAKLRKNSKVFSLLSKNKKNVLSTSSFTKLCDYNDCIDYINIDPPFGANIMYSELDSFKSVWFNIVEDITEEAIENKSQNKTIDDYRILVTASFRNAYRLLKPGHWMTVEFSNTKSSVWNSILTAITNSGFIIANVSALDKVQGSYNANTSSISVKQDLIISAYKPNDGFEERFDRICLNNSDSSEAVWEFVRTHLKFLPVIKIIGEKLEIITDREPRIIYDRLVAFFVRKGYMIPISSAEFQQGLSQRFIERDGMYFLPDQAAEYDRKKLISGIDFKQEEFFVHDESTAIHWLRRLLKEKPSKFSDINPLFMKQLGGWSKNETQLDLRELLNQNFLCYEGKGPIPEQIHSYLSTNWKELRNLSKNDANLIAKAKDRWYVPDPNKAADLEKLRERTLLKEFETYKTIDKRLRVFRLEAVRAGFKKAWQEKDYKTIIIIAEKIPSNVLEEDPKLLMWYDQAVTRTGGV